MNRKAFKLEKNELVKIEVILQNKVFHPYSSTMAGHRVQN